METHPTQGTKCSNWAFMWRQRIAMVLPSAVDTAAPHTDAEVRKLGHALWKDIAEWAVACGAERGLGLFKADHQTPKTFGWDQKADGEKKDGDKEDDDEEPPEWAYIPVSDLLIVVGEGVVGMTAEGVFAENAPGHKHLGFEEAIKKQDDNNSKKPNDKDGDKDGDRRRRRSRSRERERRDRDNGDAQRGKAAGGNANDAPNPDYSSWEDGTPFGQAR